MEIQQHDGVVVDAAGGAQRGPERGAPEGEREGE